VVVEEPVLDRDVVVTHVDLVDEQQRVHNLLVVLHPVRQEVRVLLEHPGEFLL